MQARCGTLRSSRPTWPTVCPPPLPPLPPPPPCRTRLPPARCPCCRTTPPTRTAPTSPLRFGTRWRGRPRASASRWASRRCSSGTSPALTCLGRGLRQRGGRRRRAQGSLLLLLLLQRGRMRRGEAPRAPLQRGLRAGGVAAARLEARWPVPAGALRLLQGAPAPPLAAPQRPLWQRQRQQRRRPSRCPSPRRCTLRCSAREKRCRPVAAAASAAARPAAL